MVNPTKAVNSALDTFPKLLLRNAKSFANRPAYREKDLGIWQTVTWSQVNDEVRDFAIGLSELGLKRGDTIAIAGDNRPRLYWTMLAAQSLGAAPIPVYQDAVQEEMTYVLDHAQVKFVLAEDQEQVDKVLGVAETVGSIERVIYDDERGLKDYDDTYLHSFSHVQDIGRKAIAADKSKIDWWLGEIAKGSGEDVSTILYTSGTTGKSKGVVLSGNGCINAATDTVKFDNLNETDETLAYLPLAWVGDHYLNYAQGMVAGYCLSCPESRDTVQEDLREIGPTFYFAPPRVFESLLTDIMIRMEDAGRLKRWMFHKAIAVAKKYGEDILNGKNVSLMGRLKYRICETLVYGPLKNRLGFTRIKTAYTAGEAIGPELFQFYRSLGLNLKQLYGQTEAFLYVTCQPDGEIHADTVGPPAPNVEIKLADNGEVLFKSPGMFVKYLNEDEKTRETLTEDGFVKTGDAGFFAENGHLKIIDRAKDVGKLRNGALFPPKYIENKLKFFPNIKEAVAIGDGEEFVTTMLNIDLTAVGNWAERNNVSYGSYQELAAHPDVYKMLHEHVDEVNKSLASEDRVSDAQIKRFLILHKELDADDGELTRTQKVRRSFIAERYGPLITALYDGSTECSITTEVTFEDGRKGNITGNVGIVDMEFHAPTHAVKEAAE